MSGAVTAVHGERVTGPDPGDAGADHDARRRAEQLAREHERVASRHLGQQDRAVPELVELGGELLRPGDGLHVERVRPESDRSEFHPTAAPLVLVDVEP